MTRLAIISTHPVQYNAPLFSMLHSRGKVEVKVFYTWGETVLDNKYDPGFGKNVEWDIPLLEGYQYCFVRNVARRPGSHHFNGIDNPTLIEEIKKWCADVVLIYGWAFKSHLQAMRYFHSRIPVLFRGDSTLLRERGRIKKLVRRIFLTWVYRHVDFVLYVGTHNQRYYENAGLKAKQLVFAPHAVDNSRFKNTSEKDAHLSAERRTSMGIRADEIAFLYAGKLDNNKNVKLLLEAFSSVQNPGTHLIVVGSGNLERELISKFGTKQNIHFLPFQNQSQMPMVYGMADAFVLPSLSETWGLAVNEAMACGKAVLVSSACGAAVDLVKDGQNGYIFNSNDITDLEHKLRLLIQDKKVLRTMGMASGRFISAWTFENCCEKIESLGS